VACGPARKLGPVGVSGSHDRDRERIEEAGAAPALLGLSPDYRTAWNKLGARIVSEHGRFVADVYEDKPAARFVEDLFLGDAGVGIYLIERSDAGTRFAVGDEQGNTVADSSLDAGPSVDGCIRCHANAHDAFYPVTR